MQQHMSDYKYYNFKQGVSNWPKLLTLDEIKKINPQHDKDYFLSIFRYNDKHVEFWKRGQLNNKTKKMEPSVKGPEFWDVLTDTLVWDFDHQKDPELARQDTISLAHRLVDNYRIEPNDMYVSYSGNRGFHLIIKLDRDINQEQFKQASSTIVKGLQTYDPTVCDPPRILRMEHTKNLKSGLFKIPMSIEEVDTMNMDQIRELAKTPREEFQPICNPVKLPESLFKVEGSKKNELKIVTDKFDPLSCPKGWKPYKWALADGWFEPGERHQALMIIAATCRALGYDKDSAYYHCKSALKKQAKRTGQPEFNKEELYKNIIEDSVYSDGWQGGAYGTDNAWIQTYCQRMGIDISKDKEESPVTKLDDLIGQFIDFSTNFEQNIVKTGIREIDENLMLCVGTLNGLLGQPGSGKTTVAMEILKNASLANIPSMFFSLDMGPQIVFAKVVQKESGLSFKDAMKLYRTGGAVMGEISEKIKEKYKHIGFNFKCGSTVADLKTYIQKQKDTGIALKFIVVDYLELISGPYSDPNANAAIVVHALKNLATEESVCVLLLLQTQKHSTPDIADALLSMKQIKGSSAIEQDCSTVLTLWREGYNPDHMEFDKYISFALVKNRFDKLWRTDMHWTGMTGSIRSLTDEEWDDLEKFKNKKKAAKAASQKDQEWI